MVRTVDYALVPKRVAKAGPQSISSRLRAEANRQANEDLATLLSGLLRGASRPSSAAGPAEDQGGTAEASVASWSSGGRCGHHKVRHGPLLSAREAALHEQPPVVESLQSAWLQARRDVRPLHCRPRSAAESWLKFPIRPELDVPRRPPVQRPPGHLGIHEGSVDGLPDRPGSLRRFLSATPGRAPSPPGSHAPETLEDMAKQVVQAAADFLSGAAVAAPSTSAAAGRIRVRSSSLSSCKSNFSRTVSPRGGENLKAAKDEFGRQPSGGQAPCRDSEGWLDELVAKAAEEEEQKRGAEHGYASSSRSSSFSCRTVTPTKITTPEALRTATWEQLSQVFKEGNVISSTSHDRPFSSDVPRPESVVSRNRSASKGLSLPNHWTMEEMESVELHAALEDRPGSDDSEEEDELSVGRLEAPLGDESLTLPGGPARRTSSKASRMSSDEEGKQEATKRRSSKRSQDRAYHRLQARSSSRARARAAQQQQKVESPAAGAAPPLPAPKSMPRRSVAEANRKGHWLQHLESRIEGRAAVTTIGFGQVPEGRSRSQGSRKWYCKATPRAGAGKLPRAGAAVAREEEFQARTPAAPVSRDELPHTGAALTQESICGSSSPSATFEGFSPTAAASMLQVFESPPITPKSPGNYARGRAGMLGLLAPATRKQPAESPKSLVGLAAERLQRDENSLA
eukprot:TRINITY_DN88135_c0_g1_i1.p1 TRINITY_DN88135_c0_g1~~TRINITY_DN88135_c0_g1_i1.p1  ORF type:complete len:684 (+),score=112.23 TRINITY_DN88135_c0_g1_i1:63-2114(+)